MGTFDGKTALITGSSRGIGAAVARHFAVLGATVAVHGRDASAGIEMLTKDVAMQAGESWSTSPAAT